MAREINAELLDTKIEKAQQDLVKAKHRYDAAAATLKDLLDKRDALRQKKLLDAIAQSGRSYEEIMQYLHRSGYPAILIYIPVSSSSVPPYCQIVLFRQLYYMMFHTKA